jgi:hypothetical protein
MNIAKHMETIFLAAVVLVGAMNFASATVAKAGVVPAAEHTVVVKAKRM